MMRTIKRSLIVSSLFVVLPLSSSLVFAQTRARRRAAAARRCCAAAGRRAADRRAAAAGRRADSAAAAAREEAWGAGPGLSLSPDTPQVGGRVSSPAEPPPVVAPEPSAEWKFEVTGYFRAPMRMSWGPAVTQETNTMGQAIDSGTQLRTPPMVPDANYIDWRYTNSLVAPVDRAELQVRQRSRQGAGPDRVVQPDRPRLPPARVEPGHQPGVHPAAVARAGRQRELAPVADRRRLHQPLRRRRPLRRR